MAAKDPAHEHIEHRVNELMDKKKQALDRFNSEQAFYNDTIQAIDAELVAWEQILNPPAPAAKKAAAPKK